MPSWLDILVLILYDILCSILPPSSVPSGGDILVSQTEHFQTVQVLQVIQKKSFVSSVNDNMVIGQYTVYKKKFIFVLIENL